MEEHRDYFTEVIIPKNTNGIRPDIVKLINEDINKYRDYSIKKYNGDIKRATDDFCFRQFLNEYSTAINIFGLHEEYNCEYSFNRFINSYWQIVNGNDRYFSK